MGGDSGQWRRGRAGETGVGKGAGEQQTPPLSPSPPQRRGGSGARRACGNLARRAGRVGEGGGSVRGEGNPSGCGGAGQDGGEGQQGPTGHSRPCGLRPPRSRRWAGGRRGARAGRGPQEAARPGPAPARLWDGGRVSHFLLPAALSCRARPWATAGAAPRPRLHRGSPPRAGIGATVPHATRASPTRHLGCKWSGAQLQPPQASQKPRRTPAPERGRERANRVARASRRRGQD